MATALGSSRNEDVVKSSRVSALWIGRQCDLVLREKSISCEDNEAGTLFNILLEDVIGLHILERTSSGAKGPCRTELHVYQQIKKLLSKVPSRKVTKEMLEFNDSEDFVTNLHTAEIWRDTIQNQCLINDRKVFIGGESLQPLHLLVFINPFSGKRKSEQLYRKVAFPIFEVGGATVVQEITTEGQGHAKEAIRSFDISTITGIIIAGGDGTLHEVVNGLMSRPDWQSAIQIPIGVLPTGSGNALISSLLYEAHEEYSVSNAAFQIVRGGIQPHDIASLQTPTDYKYMAVIAHWALTGDIDIESETFRILGGELRSIIGALKCTVLKRLYRGCLSYLPIDTTSPTHLSEDELSGNEDVGGAMERPQTHLLPPSLSDPVPDNWESVEGQFSLFVGLMSAFMAHEFIGHPDVKVGSGEFCLLYGLNDVTRRHMLSALVDTEKLRTLDVVHEIRTKAFRLNPITPGIISIDGELVEYTPFQVQIHPHMMRVFSRKKL